MEKKTIFALIAVVILGTGAWWLWKKSENEDKPKQKAVPLATIKADQIATLEITQPGGKDKVTLVKSGDKWQVTTPYQKPAEQNIATEATKALEKIKWGDITSENEKAFSELEVSDDKAVHVMAKNATGAVLADLYLGKNVGSELMVRMAGQNQVYQVRDLSIAAFKKEAKVWRDHNIFAFKAEEAQKLTLKKSGMSVTVERIQDDKEQEKAKKPGMMAPSVNEAKWKVVDSSMAELKNLQPESIDNRLMDSLVQSIASMRADDFQDEITPDKAGLSGEGTLSIDVLFAGGKAAQFRLGAKEGEKYYAQNADSPQVFTLQKYKAESLIHSPKDIQDKTIVAVKADDLDQVMVEIAKSESPKPESGKSEMGKPETVTSEGSKLILKRTDKGWKVEGMEEADENRVKAFIGSFEHLTGERFVEGGDLILVALQKPKGVITLKPKNGAEIVLKIAESPEEKTNDKMLIQRDKQEPMWAPKYQADNLLKKSSDFQKMQNPPQMGPRPGPNFMPGAMPMQMPH